VWLPDSPSRFGVLPAGIEADVWAGGADLPASADQVEYVVLPLGVRPETVRKIATLPSLRVVQLLSAGADHVLPYLPGHITLCNARGAHTAATAELTVGMIVASLRKFSRFAAAQREGRWDPARSPLIAGKRVLIVGYGDIGAAVERRLAGWEVTVDRVARRARDGVHPIGELRGLLADADVVVVLVPVTKETIRLVDAGFLGNMKDGALLVNAARGVIVDTGALLAELLRGRIMAALDVTDPEPLPDGHPLWQAPGLLLTPHVGGAVDEAVERAYRVVSEQLARLADGRPLQNIIDSSGYLPVLTRCLLDINGTVVDIEQKESPERNVVTHDAKR
jgi:phosphoglycerate dehydrogenase-like enzyme